MSSPTSGDAAEHLDAPAARRFVDALRAVEDRGELDAMAEVGTGSTRRWGVGTHEDLSGADGARRFWEGYRRAFAEIHSVFTAVIETRERVVLEWTGTGRHTNGRPVRYDGVTVLDLDGAADEQRIAAMRLYFDTRAATEAAPEEPGGPDDGILDEATTASAHNAGLAS